MTGEFKGAWDAYRLAFRAEAEVARGLNALPPDALSVAAGPAYRRQFRYLLGWATPAIRTAFLDQFLDETPEFRNYVLTCISAIASVDTAVVRSRIPGFAGRVWAADPDASNTAALHVLWLYGEYGAVRELLAEWRGWADWLQEALRDFEEEHPMPPPPDSPSDFAGARFDTGRPRVVAPGRPEDLKAAEEQWRDWAKASHDLEEAHREVARVGRLEVLRHALREPGDEPATARLMLPRWGVAEDIIRDHVVGVIGEDLFETYYPLLLDIAASDAIVAPSLLRSLKSVAAAAGRPGQADRAAALERAVYGTFGADGLVIQARD